MLVCEGQEGRKNGTGSLASSPGFINMRAVASLGKCYERRRGQSKADRRMSVTVVSGKSIVKSAHLISRQCGEEGFVPEFIQRHRGEGAPMKSLISCPHVIVIRKLQNSPAGIAQWLSVVDPCTQRSPVQLSGHSRLCIRGTTPSPQAILGIFACPIPPFLFQWLAGWLILRPILKLNGRRNVHRLSQAFVLKRIGLILSSPSLVSLGVLGKSLSSSRLQVFSCRRKITMGWVWGRRGKQALRIMPGFWFVQLERWGWYQQRCQSLWGGDKPLEVVGSIGDRCL